MRQSQEFHVREKKHVLIWGKKKKKRETLSLHGKINFEVILGLAVPKEKK